VMQYRRQIDDGSSLADALEWGREHA
jgi:hypothetical protein